MNIIRNEIYGGGCGIHIVSSNPLVTFNNIHDCSNGITVRTVNQTIGPPVQIHYNSLLNFNESAIKSASQPVNATYNYWGTTNEEDIRNMNEVLNVYGEYSRYRTVEFSPWLDSPPAINR